MERASIEEEGTLVASGLIAGEAIVGILLAAMFLAGVPSLAKLVTGADEPGLYRTAGGWLSLIGFASLVYVLVRIPTSKGGDRAGVADTGR